MQFAIDIHDAFGRDLTQLIMKHQPQHVILHTYTAFEHAIGDSIFNDQAHSVQGNGCTAGSYMWGFQAADPWQSVADQIDRFRRSAGHEVPVGWVDCETYNDGRFSDPGPDVDWLLKAATQYNAYGVRKGLYTSPYYAHERWGNRMTELATAGYLLWLADWGPPAVPALTSPYLPLGGWTTLAAKQWVVSLGGVDLDRDVIDDQYTVPMGQPEPEPHPGHTDAEIIEGLRIALDDVAYERLGRNIDGLKITASVLRDSLKSVDADISQLESTRAEARRIRAQFLGE